VKSIVLLIDDDPIDLKSMELLLKSFSYEVITARSGHEGLEKLGKTGVDIVVSDIRMPGMSGEEVVASINSSYPGLPVVLVTAHGDIRSAVDAMKLGAFDYVVKPPDPDEFKITLSRALEHSRLRKQNARLLAELEKGGIYGDFIIGRSPAMTTILELINRVAKVDSTVLITGETGTGKELVARMIHYKSPRADKPLVALNCASLNQNLIESELFGHEKGAFTGALTSRRGRFEEADGGTLFLDEVSEIPAESQAKLLRVLQEGELQRVGGSETLHVDVRVVASSNRNLEEMVKAGDFRQDLFYRLMVIPIDLPPLRERRDDIGLLALHFADYYGKRYRSGAVKISSEALDFLSGLEWKGNVRELQHSVERAVVLSGNTELKSQDFMLIEEKSSTVPGTGTLTTYLDGKTREYLLEVLNRAGWNKQNAAEILDIERTTLYRLLKKLGIEGNN